MAPTPIPVTLTYAQLSIAAHVATMREYSNLKQGRGRTYGGRMPGDHGSIEAHVIGCCTELAVARYLNLFWCGSIGDIRAADVGGFVEVRAIRENGRRLILHPKDHDERPFVLVLAEPPTFSLLGWTLGRDGKRPEFWDDVGNGRPPAFFVPVDALRDPVALLGLVVERRD